jgi:isopentenyl-diphosphate delta-isomerase
MEEQKIILVNEQDQEIGLMEKMQVHREGILHRAFSVFVFDNKGRMLLQQRAAHKYHGAYLWTNACCSHPYPGEPVHESAKRRLQEELGFDTELEKIFSFIYEAKVENELTEHEYDHVFAGEYSGEIKSNPEEVADHYYDEMHKIRTSLEAHPEKFTAWFRIAFPRIEEWWKTKYK